MKDVKNTKGKEESAYNNWKYAIQF